MLAARLLELQARAEAARIERQRRSFAAFVMGAWSQLEGGELIWAKHLDAICHTLQSLAEGWLVANGYCKPDKDGRDTERKRLMRERVAATWRRHGLTPQTLSLLVQNLVMNLPPGTLKSRLLMVFLPAWLWLHAPDCKFLCISGTPDNVVRDSHAHRDLVRGAWYTSTFAPRWLGHDKADAWTSVDVECEPDEDEEAPALEPDSKPIELRKDIAGVSKWANTCGGERYSTGATASVTGLHVNFILYDDPDDAEKVFADAERERTHRRWTKAQESRVMVPPDRSCRIINQQRVHAADLSAYVLGIRRWSADTAAGRMGWAHLCIPLEFGKAPKNVPAETPWGWRDWRTVKGEVLSAELFSEAYVADLRIKLGSAGFEGQANQNPDSGTLGMLARSWLRFFRVEGQDPHTRPRPDGCTDEAPYIIERIRLRQEQLDVNEILISCDATFGGKKETSSNVGLGVFLRRGQCLYWIEDHTEKMGYRETRQALRDIVGRWGNRGMPIRLAIEKKANGGGLIEELTEECRTGELLGADDRPCVVVVVEVETGAVDKKARFQVAVPWVEAGLLYILDGAAWADVAIAEVCGFPHAEKDDRADMLSQAVKVCGLKSSAGYDIKRMVGKRPGVSAART